VKKMGERRKTASVIEGPLEEERQQKNKCAYYGNQGFVDNIGANIGKKKI